MGKFKDTYYVDKDNMVYFLSAEHLKNIDAGLSTDPRKNSWKETPEKEAISIANPPPSSDIVQNQFLMQIQITLDEGARRWQYDNMLSAVSYAYSSNKQFSEDAKALIEWRDQVWQWAISKSKMVQKTNDISLHLDEMPKLPAKPNVRD